MIATSLPSSPAFAQAAIAASAASTAPANPAALIASTINAFPSGGEPLKLAISDLIVAHPNLAPSLATYVRTEPSLTPEQKEAIGAGLSDGLNRLGIVAQEGDSGGVNPLLVVLGAALVGGGVAALVLSNNNNKGTPSPN